MSGPMKPTLPRTRSVATFAAVIVIGAVALSACGIARDVHKVADAIHGNKATIDAFTTNLQSSASTTFAATYVTTGSSPATVVYAVKPPTGVTFIEDPSGQPNASNAVDLISIADGEYSCTSGSPVTCQKLGTASAATQNAIFTFYTPAHWVTFLHDFALAAGLAGDKVTSSTMTVHGFSLSCVDFVASGVPGTSTICTTKQGILGYVKVASDSTSFEISHYTSSPPASLFELPAGAKVTTVTAPSS
jgi:hypothetical protein